MSSESGDRSIVVVGGGIVGLATAWTLLQRDADRRVEVLEKEPAVATHQTGRNSGVIHAGIYYKPGTLKATLCRRGKRMLEEFATRHGIPFERCGKLVVATNDEERGRLGRIEERARENGVECRLVDAAEAREIEPHVNAVEALHVAESGIIDYRVVCETLADEIRRLGGEVRTGIAVEGMTESHGATIVRTDAGPIECAQAVNCGGLQSDRLARVRGVAESARIVPFRGDYYELTPEARRLCRGLIYPVPDPSFPFLGVHFTKMIDGGVECGPNAVLSLAREGYGRFSFNLRDAISALGWPGLQRLMRRHWRMGIAEFRRSWSRALFTASLQRLVPEITADDIVSAPAGNRAQALLRNGDLVDDFLVQRNGPITHVINAPSPAATASLAIADYIADLVEGRGDE